MSCSETKSCLEMNDVKIVEKCINKILGTNTGKQLENCYLVWPYTDTLSLASYSKMEIDNLLAVSGLNRAELSSRQSSCRNFYTKELEVLSPCNDSHVVFSASILYENLIQIRLTDHWESISQKKVQDKFGLMPNQILEYIFVIRKNGEADILLQNGIFYE